MRVFQNAGLYAGYLPRLKRLLAGHHTFDAMVGAFLADRYGAAHLLLPVLARDTGAFFTNADHEDTQRAWAREHGMPAAQTEQAILLAQIEHHRSEVFYNMDPMRFGNDFVARLPGCVKHRIAWRAAPSRSADFSAYDLLICNFPGILEGYRQRGWRAAYFAPAHDPEMDAYAANSSRDVDVLFVGGYSRHHQQRAAVLEAVAALRSEARVVFHLDRSRLTRLAESPFGLWPALGRHRRPAAIRAISAAPVFGRALYEALSRAKIVLNGAVDMAGADRGNMRCFEAMGCGALMVSDQSLYPAGMTHEETMLAYSSPEDAVGKIRAMLAAPTRLAGLAAAGQGLLARRYTKAVQWQAFGQLVESLT